MLQVELCELTAASLSLRVKQLCSHFLVMPAQVEVCATIITRRWSSPLETATLGAWTSVSSDRRIRQTPSSSFTTSKMEACSPMLLVSLHLIKPNKERAHNNINKFSLSHTGIENSTVKHLITEIGLNTCYSCKSNDIIEDKSVNQTLWNVLIQAFVANGTKSDNGTCVLAAPNIISSLQYQTNSSCFSRLSDLLCSWRAHYHTIHSHFHRCSNPQHHHCSNPNLAHSHHRKLQPHNQRQRLRVSAGQLWPANWSQASRGLCTGTTLMVLMIYFSH